MSSCPRLRQLDIFPIDKDGQRSFGLRDPSGFSDGLLVVPPLGAVVLTLCDGVRSPADVATALTARTGFPATDRDIEEFLAQLDEQLFLDSPRFHAHRQEVLEAFMAAPVRAATHAGRSYPGVATDLASALSAYVGQIEPSSAPLPKALVAPHIDFARGGAVYGAGYGRLVAATDRPDLVVVFGTDHNGANAPFTLTRKAFDTPLGRVETDEDLVGALVRGAGEGRLFDEELHHRGEHSIEFQAVWLRHVYGEHCPPIVPVLCGPLTGSVTNGRSPRDDAEVRAFLDTLSRLTAGRRTLTIAGADLAHVGPRFGDGPIGAEDRQRLEAQDRATLAVLARGDADGFFAEIALDGDRRRICGLSPIFAAVSSSATEAGDVLSYAQCAADEADTSWVTIAAMTFA